VLASCGGEGRAFEAGNNGVGQLLVVFCKACGEFAGGIDIARRGCLRAPGLRRCGVPHLDDTFDAIDPGHTDRPPVFEHDDGVGIGCGDGVDEDVLVTGQRERCCVHVFMQWLVGEDDAIAEDFAS